MVFEDMQWADAGLVGFIEHLLEWSRDRRILVVTLARPEFLESHPTWGAGLRNLTSLHLEPLPDEAIVEMLEGVVPGLPAEAARRIAARAEGVPLYAVETLRMLLAQGVLARGSDTGELRLEGDLSDVAVPDSLRGLVAARLDLLPAAERSLVQDAAVLGQSFTSESLAAVTDGQAETVEPLLRELVRRELLRGRPTRVFPSAASTCGCRRCCARSPTRRFRSGTAGPDTSQRLATSTGSGMRSQQASWPTTTSRPGAPPQGPRRPTPWQARRVWRSARQPTERSGCGTGGRRASLVTRGPRGHHRPRRSAFGCGERVGDMLARAGDWPERRGALP